MSRNNSDSNAVEAQDVQFKFDREKIGLPFFNARSIGLGVLSTVPAGATVIYFGLSVEKGLTFLNIAEGSLSVVYNALQIIYFLSKRIHESPVGLFLTDKGRSEIKPAIEAFFKKPRLEQVKHVSGFLIRNPLIVYISYVAATLQGILDGQVSWLNNPFIREYSVVAYTLLNEGPVRNVVMNYLWRFAKNVLYKVPIRLLPKQVGLRQQVIIDDHIEMLRGELLRLWQHNLLALQMDLDSEKMGNFIEAVKGNDDIFSRILSSEKKLPPSFYYFSYYNGLFLGPALLLSYLISASGNLKAIWKYDRKIISVPALFSILSLGITMVAESYQKLLNVFYHMLTNPKSFAGKHWGKFLLGVIITTGAVLTSGPTLYENKRQLEEAFSLFIEINTYGGTGLANGFGAILVFLGITTAYHSSRAVLDKTVSSNNQKLAIASEFERDGEIDLKSRAPKDILRLLDQYKEALTPYSKAILERFKYNGNENFENFVIDSNHRQHVFDTLNQQGEFNPSVYWLRAVWMFFSTGIVTGAGYAGVWILPATQKIDVLLGLLFAVSPMVLSLEVMHAIYDDRQLPKNGGDNEMQRLLVDKTLLPKPRQSRWGLFARVLERTTVVTTAAIGSYIAAEWTARNIFSLDDEQADTVGRSAGIAAAAATQQIYNVLGFKH